MSNIGRPVWCLNALGYNLSRSALYLRLVPRRADSKHGKQHVRTVPVKIRRAKINIRNRHQHAEFTKEYLKNIIWEQSCVCDFNRRQSNSPDRNNCSRKPSTIGSCTWNMIFGYQTMTLSREKNTN